jgi:hypothetical protein
MNLQISKIYFFTFSVSKNNRGCVCTLCIDSFVYNHECCNYRFTIIVEQQITQTEHPSFSFLVPSLIRPTPNILFVPTRRESYPRGSCLTRVDEERMSRFEKDGFPCRISEFGQSYQRRCFKST